MSAFLVSYDLNVPGQKYEKLYEVLKSFDSWARLMDSTWIVTTRTEGAYSLAQKLHAVLDETDALFVVQVDRASRYGWLNKDVWDWLDRNVPGH